MKITYKLIGISFVELCINEQVGDRAKLKYRVTK